MNNGSILKIKLLKFCCGMHSEILQTSSPDEIIHTLAGKKVILISKYNLCFNWGGREGDDDQTLSFALNKHLSKNKVPQTQPHTYKFSKAKKKTN